MIVFLLVKLVENLKAKITHKRVRIAVFKMDFRKDSRENGEEAASMQPPNNYCLGRNT